MGKSFAWKPWSSNTAYTKIYKRHDSFPNNELWYGHAYLLLRECSTLPEKCILSIYMFRSLTKRLSKRHCSATPWKDGVYVSEVDSFSLPFKLIDHLTTVFLITIVFQLQRNCRNAWIARWTETVLSVTHSSKVLPDTGDYQVTWFYDFVASWNLTLIQS